MDNENENYSIGYVRVSTEEQAKEGFSIENQIERIKNYCKYKCYNLKEIIELFERLI